MKPLNRRLLIEVLNQEEEQSGAFFIPQAEKPPEEYTVAKVIECSDDCRLDLAGKKIVFTTFGLETVKIDGKDCSFIGESHLICAE